jgi:hypothetical protein
MRAHTPSFSSTSNDVIPASRSQPSSCALVKALPAAFAADELCPTTATP